MQVILTELAIHDLDSIADYFNLVAPYKTEEILWSIYNRIEQLQSAPYSGPEDLFLKKLGLTRRFLVEGNYKIIYSIDSDIISITQIFDARQDPAKSIETNK